MSKLGVEEEAGPSFGESSQSYLPPPQKRRKKAQLVEQDPHDLRHKIEKEPRFLPVISLWPTKEPEEHARDIAKALGEHKVDVVRRAIELTDCYVIQDLYEDTRRIETSGGELTIKGDRRKTSGGVFFAVMNNKLPKSVLDKIFEVDNTHKNRNKRQRRKEERQKKAHQRCERAKSDLDLPLPQKKDVMRPVIPMDEEPELDDEALDILAAGDTLDLSV